MKRAPRVGGAGEEETQHVFATLCRHLRLFSSFGAAVWSAPLSQVMEKGKINFQRAGERLDDRQKDKFKAFVLQITRT